MKILHTVEQYSPSVGGMQEVVKQLSERLVKLGHQVTVAAKRHPDRKFSELNGVKIIEFDISGNKVNGYTGTIEEHKRYRDLLLCPDWDIVTSFAAQQWATDLALDILPQIPARKVFVPTGFSGLHQPPYAEYFRLMGDWMKQYDVNVFLSEVYQDVEYARKHGVEKRVLIPNGAGADEFLNPNPDINIRRQLGIPDDAFLILQVGSHTGCKGHNEAIEIFEKADIKNSVFLMVGNYFPMSGERISSLRQLASMIRAEFRYYLGKSNIHCPHGCKKAERKFKLSVKNRLAQKQLLIRDLTRAETVAAYHAADMFLFPSNIECSPIVLFECMASRTPFLSSSAGNSEEIVEWCNSGKIMPTNKNADGFCKVDIHEAIKMLEDFYHHPEIRKQMSDCGWKVWRDRFTWENITKQYDDLYLKLKSQG